jgi:3-deoxy-D-manno-octulosonic-acid transferase
MRYFVLHIIYPAVVAFIEGFLILLPGRAKAKMWYEVRKSSGAAHLPYRKSDIQFHLLIICPSYGEYLYLKPVIEEFKKFKNTIRIDIAFFSSSGYSVLNHSSGTINHVLLTPFDSTKHITQFFKYSTPDYIVFSGNVLWPALLTFLLKHHIPYSFACCNPWATSSLKSLYYWLMKPFFERAEHIFCTDPTSVAFLSSIEIHSICVGNPRSENLLNNISVKPLDEKIHTFLKKRSMFLFASGDPGDDELLSEAIDFISGPVVIVPHDIEPTRIAQLQEKFPEATCYDSENTRTGKVLIVDKWGMLKDLYPHAEIVYIGGGFDRGVHNTLEAVKHYRPLIIGPRYQKFQEASVLVRSGTVLSVSNAQDFKQAYNTLRTNPPSDNEWKEVTDPIRKQHAGATAFLTNFLHTISLEYGNLNSLPEDV